MLTTKLTPKQIAFYHKNGYLHIPRVFTQAETDELASEMDWMMEKWAWPDASWTGPWRKVYMNADVEKKSKLVGMHDLQFYSGAWSRCVTNANLVRCMVDLLGRG